MMQSKKYNFYVVLLWGVVIYAISLLTYCTMKYVFSASSDNISAFGSILGACGAFFAAFVAAYLFNDWKEQHNKQVQNNLSLQVFDAFSVFERSLREYSLYVSHLEGLKSSYNGFELTWEIIHKEGHIVYIQNITSKKDEMDLNFYAFMDKLRSYYIFSNNLKQYHESHLRYFDKFFEINKDILPIITLIDHLVDYDCKYIGYTDLKNMIDSSEIQKIIINLNA